MDVIHGHRQRVGLRHDKAHPLQIIVRCNVLATPIPVAARARNTGHDRVDGDGRALAVEDGLGPLMPGIGRKRRFEPALVDLVDERQIDRAPGRVNGQHLQPSQHLHTRPLDLLRGSERVVVEVRRCVEGAGHDAECALWDGRYADAAKPADAPASTRDFEACASRIAVVVERSSSSSVSRNLSGPTTASRRRRLSARRRSCSFRPICAA